MIENATMQRRQNRRSNPSALVLIPALFLASLSLWIFDQDSETRSQKSPLSKISRTLSAQNPTTPIIAVIDTGLDLRNPHLKKHLWVNHGESGQDALGKPKDSNGIDDDHNGYIDDVHGWNFVTNTPEINDDHGHGTHVTSLIVDPPTEDGSPSFTPTPFQGRLMILKYYDTATIELNLERSVQAMNYATQMNVAMINFSGGGFGQNSGEQRAVENAEAKDVLIIAAAGNEKVNSDRTPFFPAGYNRSNILSVGAHTKDGTWLPASNWGKTSVDIALLGEDVSGFVLQGKRGRMTGTSQATAIATGLASRLWQMSPRLRKPFQMREYMILSSQGSEKLKHRLASEGAVDQDLAILRLRQLENQAQLSPLHFMDAFADRN